MSGLNLKPAQPYLGRYANLILASGSATSSGHLRVGHRTDFRGRFRIANLLVKESRTGNRFLAWRSLSSRNLKLTPDALKIGRLDVDGLGAKLILDATVPLDGQARRVSLPAEAEELAQRLLQQSL